MVDGTGWGLVCDGMGGANGGRVASTLATQTMLRYFDHSLRTIENGEEKAFMMRAFDNANRAVYEKATSDPEVLGMGTTGVCALQRGNLAHIVHAGDSRAYLWHGGAIRQLTRDHSMVQQLGREPTTKEIADELHIEESKVEEVLKIAQEPVSLETPIGEEEDSHLGDFIPDEDAPAPSDVASHTMLKEQLAEVLSTLTPREEKVLRLRFGLEDGRSRTLEEVGKEFNVTRERIRQIEAKALRKLRHPSRSKKLKDFLE